MDHDGRIFMEHGRRGLTAKDAVSGVWQLDNCHCALEEGGQ